MRCWRRWPLCCSSRVTASLRMILWFTTAYVIATSRPAPLPSLPEPRSSDKMCCNSKVWFKIPAAASSLLSCTLSAHSQACRYIFCRFDGLLELPTGMHVGGEGTRARLDTPIPMLQKAGYGPLSTEKWHPKSRCLNRDGNAVVAVTLGLCQGCASFGLPSQVTSSVKQCMHLI